MFYKYIIMPAVVLALTVNIAVAKDEPSMREILSAANMTGMCIILQSMSDFQAGKKLAGGDEFIDKFWTAEAAKLKKRQNSL